MVDLDFDNNSEFSDKPFFDFVLEEDEFRKIDKNYLDKIENEDIIITRNSFFVKNGEVDLNKFLPALTEGNIVKLSPNSSRTSNFNKNPYRVGYIKKIDKRKECMPNDLRKGNLVRNVVSIRFEPVSKKSKYITALFYNGSYKEYDWSKSLFYNFEESHQDIDSTNIDNRELDVASIAIISDDLLLKMYSDIINSSVKSKYVSEKMVD
jgi:hypothetical protein